MVDERAYVLVVDDDEDILDGMLFALRDEGYAAEGARDAFAALRLLEEKGAAALMLLDYMLPVLSGPDFLARLKADERFRDVPVVISSAAGAPAAKLAQGIQGFLEKPIELDKLFGLVARFVSKR